MSLEVYPQAKEKSNQTCVSLFSISASDTLLIKWASYLRLRYPSLKLEQTDRDDLLIWFVKPYFSFGESINNRNLPKEDSPLAEISL
jgi:hypothetical protein